LSLGFAAARPGSEESGKREKRGRFPLTLIPAILIALGVAVVLATTLRTQRLIHLLNSRGAWTSVRNLTLFFAVGYAVYAVFLILGRPFNRDLIVGEVFLLAAVFMYLVVRFAYGTIRDIMRLDEFEQLVNTDELTGLFNRRAIGFLINEEFRKARQFGFPLSIALVDIDQCHDIQEKHGRPIVDRILKRSGEILRQKLRQIDLIGRFGDEQFLCVLPGTADEGAVMAGARIRTAIRAIRFIYDDEGGLIPDPRPDQFRDEAVELSASVGVITLNQDIESTHEMLEAAALALEHARERGGNRVIAHGSLGEETEEGPGTAEFPGSEQTAVD
jgi:diguanylate cyclase (GGDEF)-like protein